MMRKLLISGLLAGLVACANGAGPYRASADGGAGDPRLDGGGVLPPSLDEPPTFAGCTVFPVTSEWNRDISQEALDPHSADYLAFMNTGLRLQPDFGNPPYGQPVAVVPGTQARVPMTFTYAAYSDPGPYPFPLDVPIQQNSDMHAVVVDQDACELYETYLTARSGSGFSAGSGAKFDLTTGASRPAGWTSATAAGLPILPGLARYDEAVEQGVIRHALTFTAGATAHLYVPPATHSSGTSTATYAPPMGLRIRLKASYDLSKYTGASLAVLNALKQYGAFLTDNASGSTWWAISGTQDSRWDQQNLEQIKTVPTSAFEVVKLPTPVPSN